MPPSSLRTGPGETIWHSPTVLSARSEIVMVVNLMDDEESHGREKKKVTLEREITLAQKRHRRLVPFEYGLAYSRFPLDTKF